MANTRGMSTILPGVGQGVGLDLALEIKSGTSLPAASIGNGINGSQLTANTVASGQIAVDVIQHATVALTSANILAMNGAPVSLLPAVANKAYVIHAIRFDMTTTATAYANGG